MVGDTSDETHEKRRGFFRGMSGAPVTGIARNGFRNALCVVVFSRGGRGRGGSALSRREEARSKDMTLAGEGAGLGGRPISKPASEVREVVLCIHGGSDGRATPIVFEVLRCILDVALRDA